MMRTLNCWNRLGAEVRARWPVHHDDGGALVVGSGDRTVRLERLAVSEPAFADRELVAVRLLLCDRGRLAEATALQLNARLAVGSLVLQDGAYELREVVDLTATTLPRLDRLLGYLARFADALRAELAPPTELDHRCFDIFQD